MQSLTYQNFSEKTPTLGNYKRPTKLVTEQCKTKIILKLSFLDLTSFCILKKVKSRSFRGLEPEMLNYVFKIRRNDT